MKKELILSPSKKKSKIEGFPALKSCMADIKGFNKVLLPIVKLDGGAVNEKWAGVPFTFIVQNVDVSRIDFRLEDGKYQLLAPLKLRKLEEYDEYDVKRQYLQTSVDTIEKLKYIKTELYSNDGMLQQSGSNMSSYQKREVYGYDTINGMTLPVTKTVQYYKGNGEWLDLALHTYRYDADGFFEEDAMHRPAREITLTEKLLYKKTRKGLQVAKEKAPHLLLIENNASYARIPFKLLIDEKETQWKITENDSVEYSYSKERNPDFNNAWLIKQPAYSHFFDLYYEFIKYTCYVGEDNKIVTVIDESAEFPETISYSFNCPEANRSSTLKFTERSDKKVILVFSGGKFTLEHLGHEIQVNWESESGTKQFLLSGKYTLQQVVMMIQTDSYLWWDDFGQEKILDMLVHPGDRLKFTYDKTEKGIERIMFEVEERDNVTEGTLTTGSPQWLQSDETPNDPDGQEMEFVAQLDHDSMFGSLFLFYSEKHQMVSQVFQCT